MLSPWTAMLLVLAMLTALIHLLSLVKAKYKIDPELIRKVLHVVMGSVTLTFPWLFQEAWPVVTLSIVSSVLISIIKMSNLKDWQPVVCAQGRNSIGEVCFPIAVGLLFLLSDGNKFLFIAPMAILTYADTASCLVGMHYGKRKYLTVDGQKSTEGSLTFLLVAFVSTMILSLTIAGYDMQKAILLSLTVAIIAMLFEGIAWMGLDNMLIPMGSYLAITSHVNLSVSNLARSLTVLSVMATAIILWRKRATLNGSAILGVVLFCYFALITGGPAWLLPPVLLFLSYKYLLPRRFRQLKNFHSIYGVIAIATAGTIWLLIASDHGDPKYIFPYILSFGAHAAIISTAHMRYHHFDRARLHVLFSAILKAWCLMSVPLVLSDPSPHMVLLNVFLAPLCIGIPTFMYYLVNSERFESISKPRRWLKQTTMATLAAILGLIPLLV